MRIRCVLLVAYYLADFLDKEALHHSTMGMMDEPNVALNLIEVLECRLAIFTFSNFACDMGPALGKVCIWIYSSQCLCIFTITRILSIR